MGLNRNRTSLALAGTAGILYLVCAAFVAVAPELSLKLLGWVAHLVNVDKFAGEVGITFGGVLVGLVQILLYAYLAAAVFVWLYNRLGRS